ncbi:penicillin-binding protein 2 [Oceanicella actignis]|uniref:penicillin-binding protein 2 n=1 Tax=Oceanicella actignis TaxID=1189325 RepID=UPI0011E7C0B5|nr:penicillin-binding protein 2 [Oceanicella actignis]TYO91648.1 penicillin-binding protein 2 [Oceanicella actignis]
MSARRDAGALTRRGLVLLGAQGALMGVLALRMRQLQIADAERFRLMAEENRVNIRLIPPARGRIFDREGRPLAVNRQNYRVAIVREGTDDPEETLARLARLIDIPPRAREKALRELRAKPAFVPVAVAEHLTWEEFARVNANAPALPGVEVEAGLTRFYPQGELTAHVVGYVGRVSERELKEDGGRTPLYQIPDFQIGKSGVELKAEEILRGEAGVSRIEVNALGRVIREFEREEGKPGDDLQLTVDLELQRYAMERMKDESAAACVLDLTTGDVAALASAPGFDPNKFVFGISSKEWKALLDDPHRPLSNKTVSGQYPPGSTFKMVVALAALEAGALDPAERVFCNGRYKLGTSWFHCWRRGGHGHVDLHQSLAQSCDVFYYEIARRVGVEAIADMARRLGLGQAPPLPLPAVRSGLIPDKAWKRRAHKRAWQIGDTLNAGIGQGYVLATPIQLAVMTARIATGRQVTPRLVRARAGLPLPAPEFAPLGVSAAHLALVRGGMFGVVNDARGTARKARIAQEGMEMAGKTGTSQVRRITAAERAAGVIRNADLPWERRDHALFVCFAPYRAPRYAVSVVVEHGGGGSTAAAPIARDLMMRALFGPEPPITAYPPDERRRIEEERLRPPAPRPERPQSDRA